MDWLVGAVLYALGTVVLASVIVLVSLTGLTASILYVPRMLGKRAAQVLEQWVQRHPLPSLNFAHGRRVVASQRLRRYRTPLLASAAAVMLALALTASVAAADPGTRSAFQQAGETVESAQREVVQSVNSCVRRVHRYYHHHLHSGTTGSTSRLR